ncbi:hypothetical protein KQI15_03485 [Intestinimonas butyriciproducens]|jgi:hypothetical protein|uniref:hypothetical protein n=1 Tax=Intestinimonas butyriciproducens TaxID=1297617 RepID=UPI001C1074BB|nr:hypothetical protein [Intestinimonas butyriciproducens]MBU5229095.1 hypothetical protein [Intestinimonas butyriciproducens]
MEVNYKFVPEHVTAEEKFKRDVISYAGRLLEITGSKTLILFLSNDNTPVIWESSGRLVDSLECHFEE